MIGKQTKKGLVQGCQFCDNELLLLVSQADGTPGRWIRAAEFRSLQHKTRTRQIQQDYPLLAEQLLTDNR